MSVASRSRPDPTTGDRRPRAVVFGCAGPVLRAEERALFRDADPLGFILFRRNVEDPDQVRRLVADLRDAVGRADAPVLIDQEGGRVMRLRPPHWPDRPAARRFGELYARDPAGAVEAAALNATLIAADLRDLGIDVDCLPIADVPAPGAHDVIGDRAYAADPRIVAVLAAASCRGLMEGGVLPVVKHLPGHGRAGVDSHLSLPVVEAGMAALEEADFLPFRALAAMPLGMTAHVVYRALDADRPASVSPRVVGEVVRGRIGFEGFLFSDDIGMNALSGTAAQRAAAAHAAGSDAVLHCSGDLTEMIAVAATIPSLTGAAQARWRRARAMVPAGASAVDRAVLERAGLDRAGAARRLEHLLAA